MKLAKIIFGAIALVVISLIIIYKPKPAAAPTAEDVMEITVLADGEYCYGRIQEATEEAPYAVEEHLKLSIAGDAVTGTKSGTQSGPDMTNGYTGTLSGQRMDMVMIDAVYSYTIEGSENKEQELYSIGPNLLTKFRWALKEEGDMLIPDKTEDPSVITYVSEPCE